MHSFFLLLFVWIGSVIGLRLPANAIASTTAAPGLQRRAAPSLPCDFSPTNGLPPVCLGSFPSSLPPASSPAPTAAPTCFQQNQDPDAGINQQGCICNVGTTTKTLPLFSSGGDYSSSCAWPNLDQSTTLKITTNFGPVSTNSAACSVCTPTAMDAQTCTSIPNCYPETPTITVQVGTSPVPVATLTSSALFTSISSAISVLCLPSSTPNPPPTAVTCSEGAKVTINGIPFLTDDGESGQRLDDSGQVVISIGSAGSSSLTSMKALIGMAAQSFVSSASGNNCHVETWTQTNGLPRRWEGALLDIREEGPGPGGSGGGGGQPPPQPVKETMTMCNMGNFAGPQYYAQNWREAAGPGPAAYMDVEATFQVTPDPGGNLFCDFVEAAAEVIEAEFTPELLPEEQYADQEFNIGCNEVFELASSIATALPTP